MQFNIRNCANIQFQLSSYTFLLPFNFWFVYVLWYNVYTSLLAIVQQVFDADTIAKPNSNDTYVVV